MRHVRIVCAICSACQWWGVRKIDMFWAGPCPECAAAVRNMETPDGQSRILAAGREREKAAESPHG